MAFSRYHKHINRYDDHGSRTVVVRDMKVTSADFIKNYGQLSDKAMTEALGPC